MFFTVLVSAHIAENRCVGTRFEVVHSMGKPVVSSRRSHFGRLIVDKSDV